VQLTEAYLRDKIYAKALPFLLRKFGTDVDVYRITKRTGYETAIDQATSDVYSIYDTAMPEVIPVPTGVTDLDATVENAKFRVKMLIGHALYTPSDDVFAADFNDNFVITEKELIPGDRFDVVRTDGKQKSWKIVELQTVGATTDVFRRYKVAAISS